MDLEQGIKTAFLPVGNKAIDCSGIIGWAKTWDWGVGEVVAGRLAENSFKDWETACLLTVDGQYAGLCVLERHDVWGMDLDPALTPFITAVYIDPKFRGQRLSGKMLQTVFGFVRELAFDAVYLISSTQGFYEKFGFEKFADTLTLRGTTESVYKKCL